MKPKVTFSTGPGSQSFQAICHDMYKSFGGAFKGLQPLIRSPADKELLVAQLHELRTKVREMLEKVHNL